MSEDIKPRQMPSYSLMVGEVYDLIYVHKDYAGEAEKLRSIIKQRGKSGGNRLLEAACGTGTYMQQLSRHFITDGFDLSKGQVLAAKKKLPNTRIIQANMLDFDMGETYDAVVCLFSSIGYLKTKNNLVKVTANFARHTKPGGVVIVDPWIKPSDFIENHNVTEISSSNSTMSVSRMGLTTKEGIVTTLNLHHMVGTAEGISHFAEVHQLAMYSDKDFIDAFHEAGLSIDIDPVGLIGRRLCVGTKPL